MRNIPLKILFFLCLSLLVFLLTVFYLFYNFYLPSRAAPQNIIDTQSVTEESYVQEANSTTNFSLHKDEGFLYKSQNEGGAAVLDFLNSNPQYQYEPDQISNPNNVKGASSDNQTPRQLIPKNFIQNSFLARLFRDREDKFLTTHNFNLNGEHFFYNQTINNIPVFAGILAVHLRNNNEIYSVDGNLIFNEALTAEKINEDQAKEIALKKAQEEENSDVPLTIEKAERYILNLKILGLSDDETNYLTLSVTVNSNTDLLVFSKKYFVDFSSGQILYSESLIKEVLNRKIYNCSSGLYSCILARSEGANQTNNADIDKTYDILGNVYNYYQTNYNRDSYNNNGALLEARVNLITQTGILKCPNAFWYDSGKYFGFCQGMAGSDVIAHEYTHAVTSSTANLIYQAQSGALNESISDIFGYALDPDDWSMGEDTTLGIIRYMDDPTKSPNPSGGQPDRLFSAKYSPYCAGLPNSCNDSNDYCGAHALSGIVNKAFYLMTAGGNFNGCTISGIGKEKSHPIVYRVLTTYLKQQSNFKAAYAALLQSCNDLYQAGSNECTQVKAALQATEMDQQPENSQVGAGCPGSGVTRQTPECAGGQTTPTPSPTPSGTTLTPSPTPSNTTPIPSLTPTVGPTNTHGGPTTTPTPTVTPTPSNTPILTNTPIPTTPPTPTPTPRMTIQLNLKLKFQGIFQKPVQQYNKMSVRVGLFTPYMYQVIYKTAEFSADENGDWWGSVTFPEISAGPNYTIFIKSEKHIQKKICDSKPTETLPGTYKCGDGNITLVLGDNNFVFTHIYQLVGDLPDQDGIVNSYDVSLIINNLNKTDVDSLRLADLNLDGLVNTQDYSLIIAALSIRTDEE